MEDRTMHTERAGRRDFLKNAAGLLMGLILLPFERLFPKTTGAGQKSDSLKEAKFYTTNDHLAG